MELEVGDKISWKSLAGSQKGTIRTIKLSPANSGDITPWMIIDIYSTNGNPCDNSVMLCGSDSYLKMMKVSKI